MSRTALRTWIEAARPQTLPAIVGPVVVGTAVAAGEGAFRLPVLAATLGAAVLIQIGTNLANDASDFERGADTEARLGPRRVTQTGLASAGTVRLAAAIVFGLAVVLGLYLVVVGGWPIVVVGLTSIGAGLAYTGGPWPYGYRGLGDLFVFVFFGLVAVACTAYLQAAEVSAAALASAVPVACTVTAILVVNNLRDLATDRVAGKRTLAVLIGERATRVEYVALMAAPFLVVTGAWRIGLLPPGALGVWLALPATLPVMARVARGTAGRDLNPVLGATARLHLLLAVLLALGVVW